MESNEMVNNDVQKKKPVVKLVLAIITLVILTSGIVFSLISAIDDFTNKSKIVTEKVYPGFCIYLNDNTFYDLFLSRGEDLYACYSDDACVYVSEKKGWHEKLGSYGVVSFKDDVGYVELQNVNEITVTGKLRSRSDWKNKYHRFESIANSSWSTTWIYGEDYYIDTYYKQNAVKKILYAAALLVLGAVIIIDLMSKNKIVCKIMTVMWIVGLFFVVGCFPNLVF